MDNTWERKTRLNGEKWDLLIDNTVNRLSISIGFTVSDR